MTDPGPHRSGGRKLVKEFSVAGRLGPVFRAAFTDQRITTRAESTVIRARATTDEAVAGLVRTLVERGLVVQSVHRLSDMPAEPVHPTRHDLRPTGQMFLRRRS